MIIATGVRASEPQILMKEINALDKKVTLLHSRTLYKNNYNSKHTILSTFLDKYVLDRAEYIPIHFSRIPQYFNQLKIDIAIMQVAYDEKEFVIKIRKRAHTPIFLYSQLYGRYECKLSK